MDPERLTIIIGHLIFIVFVINTYFSNSAKELKEKNKLNILAREE